MTENTTKRNILTPATPRKRPALICQSCNMRPVMDRCSICEECWYAMAEEGKYNRERDAYDAYLDKRMGWRN